MSRVFIDTGGFAALYNERDAHHPSGKELWQRFAQEGTRLFTSNYVVTETLNLLRVRAGYAACLRFGNDLFASQALQVLRVSASDETRAWGIFQRYADQEFSFTDCSSFALMEDHRIPAVFGLDRHFRIMGFELLN